MGCTANDLYDVSVVFVEQNQTKVTPKSITGDITKVSCGSKRIVWNVLSDREELSGKYQVWVDVKVASKSPIALDWVSMDQTLILWVNIKYHKNESHINLISK